MNNGILGLIPARGGSKSIKKKNILKLCGKELICHTIECAKKSGSFEWVVVSTDDEEIKKVAERCGALVPFVRPSKLAQDDTPMMPVIQHCVEFMEKQTGKEVKYVVLLQPTSPLRSTEDVNKSLELLISRGADSVVSVYKSENTHPYKAKKIVDGILLPFIKTEHTYTRRQDLPAAYNTNGAIYALTRKMVSNGEFYGDTTIPYIMPKERSFDVDDPIDFEIVECLLMKKE